MRLAVPILVLLHCPAVVADVRITFPFDGAFQTGRYMPALVQFDGDDVRAAIRITGGGIVPVTIDPRGAAGDLIVPLLIVGQPAMLRVESAGGSRPIEARFRAQSGDGLTSGTDSRMQALITAFPVAWEMLRTTRLSTLAELDGPTRSSLLATGMRITDAAGNGAHVELAGPIGAVAGENAYLPLLSWDAGIGATMRRRIVLLGAIYAILMTGCAMLDSRRASILAATALTVIASAAVLVWMRSMPALAVGRGMVLLQHDGLVQRDQWTFVVARADSPGQIVLSDTLRPMLSHAGQVQDASLHLHVSNGPEPPTFHFRLRKGGAIAFLSRTVANGDAGDIAPQAVDSPLAGLARALYEPDGFELQGQQRARGGDWPALVLRRP